MRVSNVSEADVSQAEAARLVDSGPLFEVWQGRDRGTTRIDWTRRGAVRITVVGHGCADYSPPCMRRWDAALKQADQAAVLIDFWDMPTYDSGMRVQMTDWGKKHRSDTKYYVCTKSKLVLMGLSVANLALGGILNVHEKRPEFDAECLKHGLPSRT